eukprot:GILK01007158.1.p1 GENE.GILK01007158.1~~GILK01007158.1.p1  ORF type:complete len:733 (+),score=77.35 GILK01007158.1:47-2245(+)
MAVRSSLAALTKQLVEDRQAFHPLWLHFYDESLETRFAEYENRVILRRAQLYLLLGLPLLLFRIAIDVVMGYEHAYGFLCMLFFGFCCGRLVTSKTFSRWSFVLVFFFTNLLLIRHMFADPTYPGDFMIFTLVEYVSYILFLQRWLYAFLLKVCVCVAQTWWMWNVLPEHSLPRFLTQVFVMVVFCTLTVYIIEREVRSGFLVSLQNEKSFQKWKTMLEEYNEAVILWTEAGVVYYNRSAQRLFDVSSCCLPLNQAVSTAKLFGAEVGEEIDSFGTAILQQSMPASYTRQIQMDGVEPVTVNLSGSCTDWDGQDAVVIILHNITSKVLAESATSRFLASCGHELRTPLIAIMGSLETLSHVMLQAQSRMIHVAKTSCEHLLYLINTLLDISQSQTEPLPTLATTFNPCNVLQMSIDTLSFPLETQAIALEVSPASDLPASVQGDAQRLRQIMVHLVSNAIKFSPYKGVVHIRLALVPEGATPIPDCVSNGWPCISFKSSRDSADPHLYLTIEDEGVGIREDNLPRIGTVFGKLNNSQFRGSEGAGLGLVTCKTLVEATGGLLGLSSAFGTGTCAWVLFPVVPIVESLEDQNVSTSPRVLVVDDTLFTIEVVRVMLETEGCLVTAATNGSVAVNTFKDTSTPPFDIILMDCQMPVMDGYEATRQIRVLEKQRDMSATPIVAFTAFGFAQDKHRCLEAGMDDFLLKPVPRPLLIEKVHAWTNICRRQQNRLDST